MHAAAAPTARASSNVSTAALSGATGRPCNIIHDHHVLKASHLSTTLVVLTFFFAETMRLDGCDGDSLECAPIMLNRI